MKKILFSLAAIAASFSAFAHEGHGHTHGFTIQHYFVEPEHALVVFGLMIVGLVFVGRYRSREAKG